MAKPQAGLQQRVQSPPFPSVPRGGQEEMFPAGPWAVLGGGGGASDVQQKGPMAEEKPDGDVRKHEATPT